MSNRVISVICWTFCRKNDIMRQNYIRKNVIYKMGDLEMEEYFKILLGGLFGIATIVVAVLSLTSNIINGKCLNLYVNKMKRYNILFSFIPIYYLVAYSLLIMKWPILATNKWCILSAVAIFLGLITYCSYLVAQYVIDTEKFQNKVLKISIKKLENALINNGFNNSLIIDYLVEANKNININDCRIFQDEASREKLYSEYIKLIDIEKIEDDEIIIILNILIDEFGVNKAFEICNQFKVGQLTYILIRAIDTKADIDIIQMCIERIHSYFVYQSLSEEFEYEYAREIIIYNKKAMLISRIYFIETIKYLMKTKFVIKDAFYLANIIKQIYDIEEFINIEELELDETTKAFANELIKCKRTYKWTYNGLERDQAIQTALLMLGGEKIEE